MPSPLYVITLAEALPQHRAEVVDQLKQLADAARMAEGCLRFDIYADNDQPCRFNTIELWSDSESHMRHLNSPVLFRIIKLLFGKMAGMPQVRILDPVSTLED